MYRGIERWVRCGWDWRHDEDDDDPRGEARGNGTVNDDQTLSPAACLHASIIHVKGGRKRWIQEGSGQQLCEDDG